MGNTNGGLFSATAATLGNVQPLAQSGQTYGFAQSLTTDASYVYFSGGNSEDIYKCALGGCGGAPTILATGQADVTAMVNDGSAVYWVNVSGQVVKVAK